MATNQELRHQSLLDALGVSGLTYNEAWHATFDAAGIAAGPFNGRMLAWINDRLGTSYTNLPGAQNAFAIDQGFASWSAMGTFDAGGFEGILDQLSTAAVGAWSISRLLTVAYEGPLVRLRRSSDNAESDFSAGSDGLLDTTAIATWLGVDTGYVRTVYDQVGSADMAQTTAARQPIYNASEAGLNGLACGDLSNAGLSVAASITVSDKTIGLYGVMYEETPVESFPRFITSSDSPIWWLRNGNSRGFFSGGWYSIYPSSVTLPQGFYFGVECDGTNNTVYYRGQGQTPVAFSSTFSVTTITVGTRTASIQDPVVGAFAELLYFADPLSSGDRGTVGSNQSTAYGIAPL